MNRAELHNTTGFHPASLIAVAAHLRATLPRKAVPQEPTALIRNEGFLNGYLSAIEAMIDAASPQVEKTEKKDFQMYSQPENQNKK